MKFILNKNYRLRGWQGSPGGLVDWETRDAEFFSREQYEVLLKCDGGHDLDQSTIGEDGVAFLRELEEHGVVRPSSFWDLLDKEQLY